jgi:hypothetical protein
LGLPDEISKVLAEPAELHIWTGMEIIRAALARHLAGEP